MKKNVFQMSKSVLLIRRAMLLLTLLACSLFVNAGKSWTARYQVNIDATGSTGSGTVYLSAERTYANATKNDVMDSVAAISTSRAFSPTDLIAKMNLDRKMDIPEGDNQSTARNTKCQHNNIRIRAVASPGSTFQGWKNGPANNSVITSDITIQCDDKVQNNSIYTMPKTVVTYYPIFAIRTYYYATPAAQTTEGGTICTTGTTSTRPADNDALWSTASIARGTTQSQTADNNGADARATIGTYYYHAKANNNYDFLGWYDKNGLRISGELSIGYQLVATSEKQANPTTDNLKAVFAFKSSPATIVYNDVIDPNYDKFWTGTEKGAGDGGVYESFPYRKKTKVDLKNIFDVNTHNALFDVLYIFGLTTNNAGGDIINAPSTSVGCNAMTLCYVYHKSNDGTHYVYNTTFDAVGTRFDHGTSMNGKHLYFTGYCPFAYMGVNASEEGWMYFKDDRSATEKTVDIYLDNCEIMGRYKTPTGKNAGYNSYTLELTADIGTLGGEEPNNSFIFGASSPFIFTSARTSSSEPYQPTIHIAGQNHLQGQLGSYITKTVGHVQSGGSTLTTIDAGINGVYTYSSPITIKPIELNTFTDLVMTDIWKDNTITNGYLKLDATKPTNSNAEKVVAIDLGSKNGSLTINGGQYHLRNSAADGTYACNLAIGYRRFSKLVEKDAPLIGAVKVLLHLYGFGGDVADCKVIINSGTFTMYKNMYMNGSTPLGAGYYKDQENFLDLRLPAGDGNSQINGGTFNGISNVLMCSKVTTTGASPENARGNWLCLHDVEITSEDNGVVTDFALSDPFDAVYNIDPCYNLTTTNNITGGRQYGAQSLNFYEKDIDGDSEKEKVVTLLLYPGKDCEDGSCCPDCEYQKEAIIFQWATAIPKFEATKTVDGQEQAVNVGGDIKVEETPSGEDVEYQTNQLLYMDCAGMENYSMNLVAQGAKIIFDDPNQPRGQVVNENDYRILKHLNILKSVQADTWYTFTAPFNVHDISVVETNETTISKKNRAQAIEQQAQDNLQILYDLQDFIIPTAEGRASSLILTDLLKANSSMPNRVRQPLTHYDGSNMLTANYYLYELKVEEFSTGGTGENLEIEWKPVKRNAGEPLMSQGKTYAIQFPWCPMCNDLYVDDPTKKRTYYDYWSNKLVLFHGNGPQTVLGIAQQSSLATAPAAGSATLAGNSTLADMTAPAGAYVHQYVDIDPNDDDQRKQDWFIQPTTSYPVKPTEGYLLYTPKAGAQMPARISRSGQMVYPDNTTTDVEGVPTIGDRTSIMLFDAMDGFEVLSLCEQLVMVYNLQGNLIFRQQMAEGEQVYVATGSGIFVVRGESETIKVMVD